MSGCLDTGNFLYLKRGGGTNDLGRGNAYDLVVVPHDATNPGSVRFRVDGLID